MYDYRFRTLFQIDFYTTVILTRNPVVIKSQWAKWKELKAHKKPSLDRAVDICARIGASEIMSFKHDWNTEIVAQFYATLYVDSDRVMH
jgi:hypothetical protein